VAEATGRKPSFWDRRFKIALWIAVAEGILVALDNDFTRVVAIVIAVPIILFHLLAGRNLESPTAREISWTIALSQAMAVVLVIFAVLIGPLTLILAGVFAAVAIYLLLQDKPAQAK
jgi:hypothetical protein